MTLEVTYRWHCDGKGTDEETGEPLCTSSVPSGPHRSYTKGDNYRDGDGFGDLNEDDLDRDDRPDDQVCSATLPPDWLRIVHHRAELYSGSATHRGYYEHTRTLHLCPLCAAPLLALLPDPFRK